MKKSIFICLLSVLVSMPIICLAQPPQSSNAFASSGITQNDRLLQRPEWDGAIMQKSWVEGAVSYENWDFDGADSDVWDLGLTFITSLPSLKKLELGGRIDFLNVDTDGIGDENGVSDMDVWGKYQIFTTSNLLLSAGLLITLPTGSEDILQPKASGECNVETFVGARYQVNKLLAAIGHAGLRQNSDADLDVGPVTVEIEGELQIEAGGGVIYQATSQLLLQGELNLATEAYEDFENDIQLRGGADYALNPNLHLRGGASIGLDDGAPDFALTFRCAYLF